MKRATCLSAVLCGSLAAGSARADTVVGDGVGVFQTKTLATGLTMPTDFRFLPDGRAVIVELGGRVMVQNAEGVFLEAGAISAVLPPKNGEQGLFSVEVHPDFDKTRLLYFYYARSDAAGGSDLDRDRLVTFVLRDDDTLDLASERVLVDGLQGPAGHHGGGLGIGPDRKLYLAVGDTGCLSGRPPEPPAAPANYFATCLTQAQGKILRLELDGSVPADNPLVGLSGVTACGETCGVDIASTGLGAPYTAIWAWGFRNPFRMWIDPLTGTPWVGDVGEMSYEEVTLARRGGHHGWPFREGMHGWPKEKCAEVVPGAPCVEPAYECTHGGSGPDSGCVAITGGGIVDDCTWPVDFRGRYFFSDSGSDVVSSLRPTGARDGVVPGTRRDIAVIDYNPGAVRPGLTGDLYVLALSGHFLRIEPITREVCSSQALPPPLVDGGLAPPDAAAPVDDAGPAPASVLERASGGGCGCRHGGRADLPPLLALALLSGLVRRRACRRQ